MTRAAGKHTDGNRHRAPHGLTPSPTHHGEAQPYQQDPAGTYRCTDHDGHVHVVQQGTGITYCDTDVNFGWSVSYPQTPAQQVAFEEALCRGCDAFWNIYKPIVPGWQPLTGSPGNTL